MIGFLQKFEQYLGGFQLTLLPAMAVITLAAGLFVCFGGLGFRKVLFAVIGIYCGIICAMLIAGANLMLAIALVGICVLLSLRLQENFLVLVASAFAAIYGFSVLIKPYFSTSDELLSIIRGLFIGVPFYNWPILLAVIAVPIAVSSSFWRGSSVVLCSASGTVLLLAGTIMLLKHSGFDAVSRISSRREFYLELFIAVTAVFAAMQYFILPRISSRFAAARESVKAKAKRARRKKGDDSARSKSTTWRTA